MHKAELEQALRDLDKSEAWQLCLVEIKDQMNRALSDAITSAKNNSKPDYHLGIYDVLDRVIIKLPQRLLDKLQEREE